MMRTWVYNRIIALSLPNGMASRVISSGAADNPGTPFIILTMGVEQKPIGMPAESKTQVIPFDVWVHDVPGSMVANIDDGCRILKEQMPMYDGAVVGNMSIYECQWEETSGDLFDDHYKTNTRRVSFRLWTRR